MSSSSINPLQAMHEQAEATFLPYGADLQVVESYGEVEAEYAAIRKGATLMDAPHRSVVILTGKDRLSFLHNKITNDTQRLTPGMGCYAYLLNLKGRIVMDMNVLQTEEATLVEVDRRLAGEFVQRMEKFIFSEDVRVLDGSQQLGRLSVIGPKSHVLLSKVLDTGVETLQEPLRHARRQIGKTNVTLFRNDQTGEPQYELIVPRDQLVALWQILHEAGGHEGTGDDQLNLRAIGWSAYNTARIEAGTPLFGIDISDNYLPMETAHWYARAVCVSKGCYIGQEIVARMHAHSTVARLLVGMKVMDAGPGSGNEKKLPVAGTDIFNSAPAGAAVGSQQVGIVTSSCMSPMLGYSPIAMGYVKKAFATPADGGGIGGAEGGGRMLELRAEGSRVHAQVVPLPFWRK
jgi:folate-binding protein YgfZ